MYHLLAATLIAAFGSSQVAAAPTKAVSCSTEHEKAHLVRAEPVDYPAIFELATASATAQILVDLSETGRVLNTRVAKSSGSSILDRAAIVAVASSLYTPETTACTGVAGSYAVDVDFEN